MEKERNMKENMKKKIRKLYLWFLKKFFYKKYLKEYRVGWIMLEPQIVILNDHYITKLIITNNKEEEKKEYTKYNRFEIMDIQCFQY